MVIHRYGLVGYGQYVSLPSDAVASLLHSMDIDRYVYILALTKLCLDSSRRLMTSLFRLEYSLCIGIERFELSERVDRWRVKEFGHVNDWWASAVYLFFFALRC